MLLTEFTSRYSLNTQRGWHTWKLTDPLHSPNQLSIYQYKISSREDGGDVFTRKLCVHLQATRSQGSEDINPFIRQLESLKACGNTSDKQISRIRWAATQVGSHWGKNGAWGGLRIGCSGEYLGLRGTRKQGSGENYIMRSLTLIVLMWRIGWAHNNARK